MLQTMKTAGSPAFTPQPRQDIADRQGLARDAARDLAAVAALVLLAALGLAGVAGLGLDYTAKALLVLAAAAWQLWRGLGAHPHARFGPANRVTLVIIGFYVLMALGSLVLEYRTVVLPMTLAVFPGALYILALTVISMRRGYAPAKIFLLAWSCLLLGTALYASVSFGILPKTFVTEYGIQIGSALEMILLSFALAYRYARLRSENETLVREHNEQLERHVARRTSELSTALEQLAEANQRLRESNRRDALTGLFNRRHFRDVFEHQMHHAAEHRQALGVLLIDLDHFKKVNDTYGHLAGDECLRWLGRCLSDTLSVHGAVIARFGGEEFVAVVPDMLGDRLLHLAEQLRVRICSEPVRYAGNNIGISASIGAFVLHPGTGIGVDEALHRADDALYAAKDRGRNCVHAAEDITL